MRAIVVRRTGGPEVLEAAEVPDPQPGPGQLLVDVAAAGVNFMDIYQREGRPPYSPGLPYVPGAEGAGTVLTAGLDVTGFAAAELLQGMTAHYLSHDTFPVGNGDTVVVHAAAGGVGLLLTQMVTMRGGIVVATTSTAAKAVLARQAGAAHLAGYDDFAAVTRQVTGGAGAAAVYDGVGRATFDDSLSALRPRGCMVLYGAASGPVPPFELQRLAAGGSLFITRPTLGSYIASRDELRGRADDLFSWIARGRLSVRIGGSYPLAEAGRAHQDLASRRTTGKLILLP